MTGRTPVRPRVTSAFVASQFIASSSGKLTSFLFTAAVASAAFAADVLSIRTSLFGLDTHTGTSTAGATRLVLEDVEPAMPERAGSSFVFFSIFSYIKREGSGSLSNCHARVLFAAEPPFYGRWNDNGTPSDEPFSVAGIAPYDRMEFVFYVPEIVYEKHAARARFVVSCAEDVKIAKFAP